MRRKIIIVTAITALLISGGAIVIAAEAAGPHQNKTETNQYKYNGSENGMKIQNLLRIRYMLRELIGPFMGDCHTISNLSGILTKIGTRFYLNEIELSFGPVWYLIFTIKNDYNLDGENQTVYQELISLVGTNITVEGHYQSIYWLTVLSINNIPYREVGRSLWSQGEFGPQ